MVIPYDWLWASLVATFLILGARWRRYVHNRRCAERMIPLVLLSNEGRWLSAKEIHGWLPLFLAVSPKTVELILEDMHRQKTVKRLGPCETRPWAVWALQPAGEV